MSDTALLMQIRNELRALTHALATHAHATDAMGEFQHAMADYEAIKQAAIKVCQTRYSAAQWEALDAAIGDLVNVLIDHGVEFDNPRIQG